MKNIIKSLVMMFVMMLVITGVTRAAFTASASVTGNTFSTGSAGLQLWNNVGNLGAGTTTSLDNVVDFLNIYPMTWTQDYLAKVRNTGTVPLNLSLSAVPTVANADLAQEITVQVWTWNDVNGDGLADGGDGYVLVDTRTVASWQALGATGVALPGTLAATNSQGVLLRFTAGDLVNASLVELQNATMTYNFVVNGVTP